MIMSKLLLGHLYCTTYKSTLVDLLVLEHEFVKHLYDYMENNNFINC